MISKVVATYWFLWLSKRIVTLVMLYLLCQNGIVQAQTATSDPTYWISYEQTYYKIPVGETGIYRIPASDLRKAGIPIDQINPASLQLFHRGIEQAIYVANENSQRFDYLEFYGRRNDGSQDSLLYHPKSAQPHAYYSLFNDTTAYFLTWRLDNKPGIRMATYADTAKNNLPPETYHWAEELRLFTDDYPGWAAGIPPKIEYSFYEEGEGYTSTLQTRNKPFQQTFYVSDPVRNGPNPQIDFLLVGRGITNHQVICQLGSNPDQLRSIDTARFATYQNAKLQKLIRWDDIGSNGKLVVSTISQDTSASTDNYSVSYIRIRYPQRLTANNSLSINTFRLRANSAGRSLLNVANVQPGARFWDITDPGRPIRIIANVSAQLVVSQTESERIILYSSQPKTAERIQPVRFTNWKNSNPTYLIISHDSLMKSTVNSSNPVRDYATYRASKAGGSHDTLVVTMQQLIDQFSYGERHPLAIRRFIQQLLRQNNRLQYVLLMGQSRSTPGIRRNAQQATLDMVMTAGFPGSDLEFVMDSSSHVPTVPIGRINAGNPQQVLDYLNKVIEYEHVTSNALWRKNILHLSGGQTSTEIRLFRQYVDTYRNMVVGTSLGAHLTTLSKTTDLPTEFVNVAPTINNGVGVVTFFGHSGLDVTDLDIGYCSNDALGYQNKGKYPLLLVNGCAIGNFFFGRPTLTSDWVLTPNRGAIAAIAHSHLGYPDVMHPYSQTFYSLLTDSTQLHKSIGQLQQETIRRILANTSDERAIANCQQMVLQGDPAIRLFPFKKPDYELITNSIQVTDTYQQPLRSDSDSVKIRALIQNSGQYWEKPLPLRIQRYVAGLEVGTYDFLLPNSVAYSDTITVTFPNVRSAIGENLFEVSINPDDSPTAQDEDNRANNNGNANVLITNTKPTLIYPKTGSFVTSTNVAFLAHYVAQIPLSFAFELDTTLRFDSPIRQMNQLVAMSLIRQNTTLLSLPNTRYYWRIRQIDSSQSVLPAWETSWFTYAPDSLPIDLPEGQLLLLEDIPNQVRQGDVVTIPVQFSNLSAHAFSDSLLVEQIIYSATSANPQRKQWQLKPLSGNDSLRVAIQIPTEKLPGLNRISLTINPEIQPEYSFVNNSIDFQLSVEPDLIAPLLEVAIDGARITNDAIVSAHPIIDVLVIDDNSSLVLHDTTGLEIYLKTGNTTFERLSWQASAIQPSSNDHAFRIRYVSPALAPNTYELLVTARDVVGNAAVPYRARFQVIHENTLAKLSVYPNPFVNQTCFSFTLSGTQPPDNLMISITDLNGKLIRILNQPTRIGLNEWYWNGTDHSGATLPNGTYLYKLSITDVNNWPATSPLSGRILLIRE